MEVHMDDVHGFGPDPQVEKFKDDLAAHIRFRDGGETFAQEAQWSDDH